MHVCSWPSRTTVIGLMVVIGISGVVGWFPGPWWCTSLVKQGPDIKDWLSALSTRRGGIPACAGMPEVGELGLVNPFVQAPVVRVASME